MKNLNEAHEWLKRITLGELEQATQTEVDAVRAATLALGELIKRLEKPSNEYYNGIDKDNQPVRIYKLTPDEAHYLETSQNRIVVVKSIRDRAGCSLRDSLYSVKAHLKEPY